MGRYRFPGLRAFEETEAAIFNGRAKEKQALFDLIMVERSVVMFAKSGAGKSSLLRAGIIPMLAELPYQAVYIRLNRAEESLVAQVCQQISGVFGIPYQKDQTLWEYLQKINNNTGRITPILIFDQFEELFTLHRQRTKREAFIEQLADVINETLPKSVRSRLQGQANDEQWAVAEKPPRVKLVFAIRSDRLSYLHELSDKIPGILRNRFELKGLYPDQASEAIVRPAAVAGDEYLCPPFEVTPEALKEIIESLVSQEEDNETDEQEIESFQLQLVCRHLEEKMLEQHRQHIEPLRVTVETFGGAAGITHLLSDFYLDTLGAIPDATQRRNAQITIEDELIKNRSRVSVAEASLVEGEYAVSSDTLRLLVEKRLLRREERPGLGNYYELTHDTLLAPVLASRRERRIAEAAKHRVKNLFRLLIVAAGFGILGLMIAMWIYIVKEKKAKVNLLISESKIQSHIDPTRAFRLAEEADSLNPGNIEALGCKAHAFYGDLFQLNDTLYATPHYREYEALWVKPVPGSTKILMLQPDTTTLLILDPVKQTTDTVWLGEKSLDAALSPDGQWLVTIRPDSTVQWLTMGDESRQSKTLPNTNKAVSVAISSDGQYFTTMSADDKQRLWSGNGILLETFESNAYLNLKKRVAAFSPNGRQLLVFSKDASTAQLYSLPLSKAPLTIKPNGDIIHAAFSPGGQYISILVVQGVKLRALLFDSSGKQLVDLNPGIPFSLAVNDNAWILSIGVIDTVQVIDRKGKNRMLVASGTGAFPEGKSEFSPDGQLVAYCFSDKTIHVRDLKDNMGLFSLSHRERVVEFFFTDDGRHLISKTISNKMRVWSLKAHPVVQYSAEMTLNSFSPVCSFFVPGSADIAVPGDSGWICSHPSGKCPDWLSESVKHAIPWGESSTMLLQDTMGRLSSVEIKSGKVAQFAERPVAVLPPVVAGEQVALARGDSTVDIIRSNGDEVAKIKLDSRVYALDLSPDGRRIAIALANNLVITAKLSNWHWDTLPLPSPAQCLAFSADGASLLVGGMGQVYRWDYTNRQIPHPLLRYQHDESYPITAISESRDGRYIVTGSPDRNIVLWDEQGRWQHTFAIPISYGSVYHLEFSSDGRYLLSQHEKNAVFRWLLDPEELTGQMKNFQFLAPEERFYYRLK